MHLFAECLRENALGISPNHSTVEIKTPESQALGSPVGEKPNKDRAQASGLALPSPMPASTSCLSHSSAIEEMPTPRSYQHFEELSPYTNDLDFEEYLNEHILT